MCFNKRWGTIDGNGWAHTETEVACKQLGYPTSGIFQPICSSSTIPLTLSHSEVSYTKRTRYSTQSLPVYMTSVDCSSSSETLLDCDYHKFPIASTTSLDISISCISDNAAGPQCVPVTTSTCPDVFSELYYISVAGREESKTFSTVTEISDQLDHFCKDALAVYACYFIHPPCDPDRGIYKFDYCTMDA